jgi:DNA-binding transcriptional MerR regulator
MGEVVHLPPLGHYLANEVGRLAGVSGDQIGQWARYGYIRSSQSERQPRIYSYQDVAEAMAVHQMRDNGVSYEDIRRALGELRVDPDLGDWPLSSADLGTAGATVVLLDEDANKAYDLTGRPWHPLLDVSDLRRIAVDLNRGGWAARELPNLSHIEVNPERLSGRPTIRGRRVAARSVAELALAGGRHVLKDEYELDDDEIRDAEQWWGVASRYEAAA